MLPLDADPALEADDAKLSACALMVALTASAMKVRRSNEIIEYPRLVKELKKLLLPSHSDGGAAVDGGWHCAHLFLQIISRHCVIVCSN